MGTLYEVGKNKRDKPRMSYVVFQIIMLFFIVMSFIFASPFGVFDSLLRTSAIWGIVGHILYVVVLVCGNTTDETDDYFIGMLVLPVLVSIIANNLLGHGKYIQIFYFLATCVSLLLNSNMSTNDKYEIVYVPTRRDALVGARPEYIADTTEDARNYYESVSPFHADVHSDALQGFFDRKEATEDFDETLVSDEALRLWMSLDEQYAYYNGLQAKLEQKYHEEMEQLPKGSHLLMPRLNKDKGASIMNRFVRYGWDNLFTGEAPTSHENLTELFNLLNKIDYAPHLYIKENTKKWMDQLHYHLYPADRYFTNLLDSKFVERAFIGIDRGVRGEQLLMDELALFDDRFKVLENVNIREDEMNAESDAIVISQYGVFTIEAKNFAEDGQYSVHVSKDGRWLRKTINGDVQPMNDVIRQSNRHILIKQKMLNREMKKAGLLEEDGFIDIHGAIVVTNDVVNVYNESDYPVMRLSSLYEHVRGKNTEPIYTAEQVEAMVRLFKENNQPDVKFPVRDVEKEFDIYMDHLKERLEEYDRFREFFKLNN